MSDIEGIERALREALPEHLQASLAPFLELVRATYTSSSDGQIRVNAPPHIQPLLKEMAGERISAGESVISFGSGNQIGEVTLGDVAGGHIFRIQIDRLIGGDLPHDVAGLSNPYLGLAPFTYSERVKYAGREPHSAEAVARLTTPGAQRVIIFITGASGSGKSSFVQAGLVPMLEQYYRPGIVVRSTESIRPSQYPMERLLDALHRRLKLPSHTLDTATLPDKFYTFLAGHTTPDQVNVLILDQFEELFTQSEPEQREALIAILANLPPFQAVRTHILVTMRSDFLPELFQYEKLYAHIKDSIELRAMTTAELKEAIQRPLQQHPQASMKRFEPELLSKLASDALAEAAYLPLLQVTLKTIWDGGSLKLSAYTSLTAAIREHAEKVFHTSPDGTSRPPAEQQAILDMFLDLVDVSLDNDLRRDVRRRRPREVLTQGADRRSRLLGELTAARLMSTSLEQRGGREIEVVDIIHESLIANWDRLRTTIAARRQALQQSKRFELALQEWEDHDRTDSYLLEGIRLSDAQALRARNDVALRDSGAQTLLKRSLARREQQQQDELLRQRALAEAQQRRAALFRQALGIVAILFVVAASAAWFAFERGQAAVSEAERANRNAKREVEAQQTAEAATVHDKQQARILLARQLAAQSLQLSNQASNGSPQATILAIASLKTTITAEGNQAISRALAILPHFLARTPAVDATDLAASPDGRWIASGNQDGSVTVYDAGTGQVRWSAASGEDSDSPDDGEAVLAVNFSPDSALLAAGGTSGGVYTWDVLNGEKVARYSYSDRPITKVAFSADGRSLVAMNGCEEAEGGEPFSEELSTIVFWDIATGTEKTTIHHDSCIWDIDVSTDGQWVVAGSEDNTARVWNITTGKEIAQVSHSGRVRAVRFSPDGQFVISASSDEPEAEAQVWATTTGEILSRMNHAGGVRSVDVSPDGKLVGSGGADNKVRVWEPITGAEVLQKTLAHAVVKVRFSPDGQSVAAADACGPHEGRWFQCPSTVWSWNVYDGELKAQFLHHDDVQDFEYVAHNNIIVSYGSFGETLPVNIWGYGHDKHVFEVGDSANSILREVRMSEDEQRLAIGFHRFDGVVWSHFELSRGVFVGAKDTSMQELAYHIEIEPSLRNLEVVKNNHYTAKIASDHMTVEVWDAQTNTHLGNLKHKVNVQRMAISSDQAYLAVFAGSTISIWDISRQSSVATIQLQSDQPINALAFSPGAKWLAVGEHCDETGNIFAPCQGIVRVWEIATQTEVAQVSHTGPIQSVAYSPRGTFVISRSRFQNISELKIWSWNSEELIAEACADLSGNYIQEDLDRYAPNNSFQELCPPTQTER